MGKDLKDQYREGKEAHHVGMSEFHAREAVKYDAKADELEAAGKSGAAKRNRKVAERNRRLAAKHAGA